MTLLENNFLYVDLTSVTRNSVQKQRTNTTGTEEDSKKVSADTAKLPKNKDDAATHIAWGKVLNARIEENNSLDSGARIAEIEILREFFKEYFETVWGDAGKKLSKLGDLICKDIKKLGFNPKKNPILAFIVQKYVIEKLINTGLLNKLTYAVLHNVYAKNIVAKSEFLKKNNYNLIYCRNLYRKGQAEMFELLKLQSKTLKPNATSYAQDVKDLNRQVFLLLPGNKADTPAERAKIQLSTEPKLFMPDPKAVLNDLKTIQLMLKTKNVNYEDDEDDDEDADSGGKETKQASVSKKEITNIAEKFESLKDRAALVQYLFMATGSKAAKKYLSSDTLKGVQVGIEQMDKVRGELRNIKLSDDFVVALLAAYN